MKCMKCGKTAFKSFTSEAIELGFGLLVIRNIPAISVKNAMKFSIQAM